MASLTRAVTRLAVAGRQAVRSIATTTPVSGHADDVMEKWPADSEFLKCELLLLNGRFVLFLQDSFFLFQSSTSISSTIWTARKSTDGRSERVCFRFPILKYWIDRSLRFFWADFNCLWFQLSPSCTTTTLSQTPRSLRLDSAPAVVSTTLPWLFVSWKLSRSSAEARRTVTPSTHTLSSKWVHQTTPSISFWKSKDESRESKKD